MFLLQDECLRLTWGKNAFKVLRRPPASHKVQRFSKSRTRLWRCRRWTRSTILQVWVTSNVLPKPFKRRAHKLRSFLVRTSTIKHAHWQTVSVLVAWKTNKDETSSLQAPLTDSWRQRTTVFNRRETEQEKKETPAASRRPSCWLVPSEWVRSVTGFWTHSSFKRGTTQTT